MERIIRAVADETRARGAKRVTPSHLYIPLGRENELHLDCPDHRLHIPLLNGS